MDRIARLLCVLLGLAGVLPAVAADLTLVAFEGTVEVRTSTGWKALDLGSTVAPDATLKISDRGLAELRIGKAWVHLSKDGTYRLDLLVTRALQSPATDVWTLVGKKVAKVLGTGPGDRAPVVNAGVRGADATSAGDLTWAEEDDESAATLDRALDLAADGRAASALREALDASVPATHPRYPEAVLLIVTQALAVGDYETALAQAEAGRKATADQPWNQVLDLSRGLAYRGLGKATEAQKAFRAVLATDPQSPAGQEAARLLAQ